MKRIVSTILLIAFCAVNSAVALNPPLAFNALRGDVYRHRYLVLAELALQAELRVIDRDINIDNIQDLEAIKEAFKKHDRLAENKIYQENAAYKPAEVNSYFNLVQRVGGHIFMVPVSVEKDGEREDYILLFSTRRNDRGGFPVILCIPEELEELRRNIIERDEVPIRKTPDFAAIHNRFKVEYEKDKLGELIEDTPNKYDLGKWFVKKNWTILRKVLNGDPLPPMYVEIHPSGECNFNCRWCRGGSGNGRDSSKIIGHSRLMPRIIMLKLIDDIHEMNPEALVRISGFVGEPLMNPATREVFRKLDGLKMSWGLATNGVFLTADVREEVLEAKFVSISLDAGSAKSFNKLKDLAGESEMFKKVIDNIAGLVLLKKERGSKTEIKVSILVQPENWKEIQKLSIRLKRIGVDGVNLKIAHFDSEGQMDHTESENMHNALRAVQIRDNDENYNVNFVQEEAAVTAKLSGVYETAFLPTCPNAALQATVSPDGRVNSCCHYGYGDLGSSGDIGQSSFKEIWKSEERKEILKRRPTGRCKYCAPTDKNLNQLIYLMRELRKKDPGFLEWVEETFVKSKLELEAQKALDILPSEYRENGVDHKTLADIFRLTGFTGIVPNTVNEKTAFIFSEKVAFDKGVGVLLPKLAKAGIKIAVIAKSDRRRHLIDEFNKLELGGDENKIVYADNVTEATAQMNRVARFYYFKMEEDREEDLPDSVNVVDLLQVEQIIEAIGKASGLFEDGMIEKLQTATRRFAKAA